MNEYTDLLFKYSSAIPLDSYLCIKNNNIYLNNIITDNYNNNLIWNKNSAIQYFNESKLLFLKEFNISIDEFHIVQASNLTGGFPIPCEKGNYAWERIKVNDHESLWVVVDFYTSETYCSNNLALDSGNLTRANYSFRKGLIQSLNLNKPISITLL